VLYPWQQTYFYASISGTLWPSANDMQDEFIIENSLPKFRPLEIIIFRSQ
jgi:hypothetical protein